MRSAESVHFVFNFSPSLVIDFLKEHAALAHSLTLTLTSGWQSALNLILRRCAKAFKQGEGEDTGALSSLGKKG
jgi:hypothetical protein